MQAVSDGYCFYLLVTSARPALFCYPASPLHNFTCLSDPEHLMSCCVLPILIAFVAGDNTFGASTATATNLLQAAAFVLTAGLTAPLPLDHHKKRQLKPLKIQNHEKSIQPKDHKYR